MKETQLDIHGLIEAITNFKESIFSLRKVDMEQVSVIMRMLIKLINNLNQLSKESNELLRLLNCCFDFLAEAIRGNGHFFVILQKIQSWFYRFATL